MAYTTWKQIKITISITAGAAAAKSLQLCLTLCDPIHGSSPGSSDHQEYMLGS